MSFGIFLYKCSDIFQILYQITSDSERSSIIQLGFHKLAIWIQITNNAAAGENHQTISKKDKHTRTIHSYSIVHCDRLVENTAIATVCPVDSSTMGSQMLSMDRRRIKQTKIKMKRGTTCQKIIFAKHYNRYGKVMNLLGDDQ